MQSTALAGKNAAGTPFYLHHHDFEHDLYEVRETANLNVVDTLEYVAARELCDGLNELARMGVVAQKPGRGRAA